MSTAGADTGTTSLAVAAAVIGGLVVLGFLAGVFFFVRKKRGSKPTFVQLNDPQPEVQPLPAPMINLEPPSPVLSTPGAATPQWLAGLNTSRL
ncbi:hypothetical protein HDU91_003620 [Kappamyces sp. JEL0680]|nr:hypothetical protein HDU91_003620 [Kappamyces sp. JEL0680]